MVTDKWVNTGSTNGWLPDGTKPLPENILINNQKGAMTLVWGQFHKKYFSHESLKLPLKLHI